MHKLNLLLMIACILPLTSCKNKKNDSVVEGPLFTVTWKNENGRVLEIDQKVAYGTFPSYNGKEPSKTSTYHSQFEFAGWDKELEAVTSDVVYTATFNEIFDKYKIVFENYNGDILQTKYVDYNEMPSYDGDTPVKPRSTIEKDWVFIGWSPSLKNATRNTTYTAQFKEEGRKIKVTWCNYDGSILHEQKIPYGTRASYTWVTPERQKDEIYSYQFAEWHPSTYNNLYDDAIFTASYTSTKNQYKITWCNYDGTIIKSENYYYGEMPKFEGSFKFDECPEVDKEYCIGGWDPIISSVTCDQTYKISSFIKKTKTFDITFDAGDGYFGQFGKNKIVKQVEYGCVPVLELDPIAFSRKYSKCTFEGWDKNFSPAYSDETYTAIYNFDESSANFACFEYHYSPNGRTVGFSNYGVGIIDYGDGTERTSNPIHTYSIGCNGIYFIRIFGVAENFKLSGWDSDFNLGNQMIKRIDFFIDFYNRITEFASTSFYKCTADEIHISGGKISFLAEQSNERIGAFAYCTSLIYFENCEIVGKIPTYCFYYSNISNFDFSNCDGNFGSYCFSGCSELTQVVITKNVTAINYYMFAWCKNLQQVTFEDDSVTYFGESCFRETSLTSLTIPKSVTIIDHYAFQSCLKLNRVNYAGTKADFIKISIGQDVFKDTPISTIYCSDGELKLNY